MVLTLNQSLKESMCTKRFMLSYNMCAHMRSARFEDSGKNESNMYESPSKSLLKPSVKRSQLVMCALMFLFSMCYASRFAPGDRVRTQTRLEYNSRGQTYGTIPRGTMGTVLWSHIEGFSHVSFDAYGPRTVMNRRIYRIQRVFTEGTRVKFNGGTDVKYNLKDCPKIPQGSQGYVIKFHVNGNEARYEVIFDDIDQNAGYRIPPFHLVALESWKVDDRCQIWYYADKTKMSDTDNCTWQDCDIISNVNGHLTVSTTEHGEIPVSPRYHNNLRRRPRGERRRLAHIKHRLLANEEMGGPKKA